MPADVNEHRLAEQTSERTRAGKSRILVCAPFGQDAVLLADTLKAKGFDTLCVSNIDSFADKLDDCGAAILTSEALTPETITRLQTVLQQPSLFLEVE